MREHSRSTRRGWVIAISVSSLLLTGRIVSAAGLPFPRSACAETDGRVVTASVASRVYAAPIAASVYLPPCYDSIAAKLPAIYLLHGANADETQWPDVRVQPEADALIARGVKPFVVIMPGGDYLGGVDYEAFVLDDLIPGIEKQFRVKPAAPSRAIGGISMGGFWALKIAFGHPDRFVAAGGHSPVTGLGENADPQALAGTADGLSRLRVWLDVGDLDLLGHNTARLAQTLQARGVRVSFVVNAGGHHRAYWRAHTGEYLQFYADAFASAARPRAGWLRWRR